MCCHPQHICYHPIIFKLGGAGALAEFRVPRTALLASGIPRSALWLLARWDRIQSESLVKVLPNGFVPLRPAACLQRLLVGVPPGGLLAGCWMVVWPAGWLAAG